MFPSCVRPTSGAAWCCPTPEQSNPCGLCPSLGMRAGLRCFRPAIPSASSGCRRATDESCCCPGIQQSSQPGMISRSRRKARWRDFRPAIPIVSNRRHRSCGARGHCLVHEQSNQSCLIPTSLCRRGPVVPVAAPVPARQRHKTEARTTRRVFELSRKYSLSY